MHFGQYYGSSAALGYITGMYMYTDNYTNLYGFITITRYTQLLCTMQPTMYGIRISYMYRDRQSDIHYQMHVLIYSLVTVTWMPEICGKKRTQFCVHMYIGDALGCILTVKTSMISLIWYHSTEYYIQCTYQIQKSPNSTTIVACVRY